MATPRLPFILHNQRLCGAIIIKSYTLGADNGFGSVQMGRVGWWTAKIDEERGGENHPDLWLSFAKALGVACETVSGSEPLPASQALLAAAKIDGLRRFCGITSQRGLRFFSVHLEADTHHAGIVGRLVDHHAGRLEDRRLALGAGRRALEAVWSMLDAV